MGDSVIITAAITGSMTVPSQSPNIPITPEEIAKSAVAAHEAGAAVVHIHAREEDGRPSSREELFKDAYHLIASSCEVIVQPTTGGGVGMSIEERCNVVRVLKPEMATFNSGSINFAIFHVADRIADWKFEWERGYLDGTRDYVFRNTFSDLEYASSLMRECGTKPELEVYDVGHLYNIAYLLEKGLLDTPVHIQFVLGVLGALAARPEELMHLHERATAIIGEHTWSVAGVGYAGEFQMATMSLILGGHVRVGMEDNLRISPGELATSNAELVGKIARIARDLDREPATPTQAREILGIRR
jgi:uncharacterized protein (DUF849 family)